MADQEVIKHTKKIYKIWSSKEHGLWHKVKEFVLEILIIVFAVSLSIWLHGRTEHKHQLNEVKAFLQGTVQDLQSDIIEMKSDRNMYVRNQLAYRYIRSLKFNESANPDSMQIYRGSLFTETGLVPNNGRFEGFKSSGKIGAIENLDIQNDIMNLYQEEIPTLVIYTDYYSRQKRSLWEYFTQNLQRRSDSTSNYLELFSRDLVHNMSQDLVRVNNILDQYDKCIATMNRIIAATRKEYGQD